MSNKKRSQLTSSTSSTEDFSEGGSPARGSSRLRDSIRDEDVFESSDASNSSAINGNNSNSNGNGMSNGNGAMVVITSAEFIDTGLDQLSEKRVSTREKALMSLLNAFRSRFCLQFLENRRDTLIDALHRSIRSGTSEIERRRASELFSVLMITIGADHASESFDESKNLIVSSMSTTRASETLAAMIDALAWLTFVRCDEAQHTIEALLVLEQYMYSTSYSDALVQKAIEMWSLLITSLDDDYVCTMVIPTALQKIYQIALQRENVGVRLAAGEAVALLIDTYRDYETTDDHDFELGDLAGFADVRELEELLIDLASETNRHRTKEEMSKQRKGFKRILRSIQEGDTPEERLEVKHQRIELFGWPRVHQLHCLREALAGGLNAHLLENPLLHEVLSVSLVRDMKRESLSKAEKRALMSPSSIAAKSHTRRRARQRGDKAYNRAGDVDDE